MDWKHLLASITGTVEQALLLRNESLVTENRILRNQITDHVRLTDSERTTLAAIGQQLGKQALEEVATIVKSDTILAWHRRRVAQNFDGSTKRKAPGRLLIDTAVGMSAPDGGVLLQAFWTLTHPNAWEPMAIALTGMTVAFVLLGRPLHPLVSGVLHPQLTLHWTALPTLFISGGVIALVGFSEAVAIAFPHVTTFMWPGARGAQRRDDTRRRHVYP